MPATRWPEGCEEQLKQLWETHSASRIGTILGRTKNSVIGKAHRLGLPPKTAPAAYRERPAKPEVRVRVVVKQVVPVTAPEPVAPEPVNGGLHILDLKFEDCREVIGYGMDGLARYCGNERKKGSKGFCQYHHSKNYEPIIPRLRKAS